jgi:hypothetical protein
MIHFKFIYENSGLTLVEGKLYLKNAFLNWLYQILSLKAMKSKEITFAVLLLLIFSILSTHLFAQEESVAFDSKNKILRLTPDLEKKTGLYTGKGQFKYAELFLEKDSVYILEIHYFENSKLFRNKRQIALNELNDIRLKVDEIAYSESKFSDTNEGFGLLLTGCLSTGLSIYGTSLIMIANTDNTRINVGLYMLGSGSSFFIPYYLLKNKPLSYGQANLMNYGLTRGFAHGLLLRFTTNSNPSVQSAFMFGDIFGIGETVCGYYLPKRFKINNGLANLITVYGDFGFFTGIMLSNQFDLMRKGKGQGIAAFMGMGGLAGLATGYYFGKKFNVSTGGAEIINTTAYLAAFAPISLINHFKPQKPWFYTTPALLAGIAGIYIGHRLVNDKDFSFTQGYITKLGTFAGGLVGLGTTYLLVNNASTTQYLLGTYMGAQASFIILYNVNLKFLKAEVFNRIKINLSPENFFLARTNKSNNPQLINSLTLVSIKLIL